LILTFISLTLADGWLPAPITPRLTPLPLSPQIMHYIDGYAITPPPRQMPGCHFLISRRQAIAMLIDTHYDDSRLAFIS